MIRSDLMYSQKIRMRKSCTATMATKSADSPNGEKAALI